MSDDSIKKDPRSEQAVASDESIQEAHSILLSEESEPKEGDAPLPLLVLGFVTAMIFVGIIYFVHYRGGIETGFHKAALIYDERYDPTKAVGVGQEAKVDPVAQGKILFQTCAACHQASGVGVPGVYPPLAGSEWVTGSDERVVRIMLHGLSGPVKVAGADYNGNMPVFGPGGGYNWSDEKIAYVITYIRQEWGNKAAEVTADKVKEIREKGAAGRAKPWSSEELEAIK